MSDIVTIVPTRADNPAKVALLKSCLGNIPTKKIVSTNYPVDNEVFGLSDYVLHDNKNPLLFAKDFERFGINLWTETEIVDENGAFLRRVVEQCKYDHGFAAYTLISNGIKLAKANGFKKCHIVEYDYEWNSKIMEIHSNDLELSSLVCYRYTTSEWGGEAYNTSFFSGRTDALLHFFGKFNSVDEYYSQTFGRPIAKIFEPIFYFGMLNSGYNIKEYSTDWLKKNIRYDASKKAV
jgi:hypothetical protein